MPRGEMQRQHLTDSFCRRAKVKPGQRVTVYSDTETRGFCLVVTATGSKTFAVRYTLKEGDEAGKQVRTTLGPYLGMDGKAVDTWRREAAKAIGDAARGIDKATKRAQVRRGATMQELCARYLKEHAPKKRSEAMDRNRIDRYLLPAWKHRKAASITRGDVHTLLAPIEHGDKAKKLPPRPYEAIGVLALVKKLFSFAIDAEVVNVNPAARMKIDPPEKDSRHLASPGDLRAFWDMTGGRYAEHMPAPFAAALRFQLLTGSRPGEVFGLTWDELDLEANEWLLPARRSKNKRAHLVPLTPTLRAIIDAQPRATSYVFPARRGGRTSEKMRGQIIDRTIEAFNEAGGKLERFTAHDLRRTAETIMAAAEVPKEYRDRLLNHVDNSVGGTHYNYHDYKEQKREAMLKLEQRITELCAPDPGAASNVIKLPARAG